LGNIELAPVILAIAKGRTEINRPTKLQLRQRFGFKQSDAMQGSNIGQFVGPSLVATAVAAAGGAWTGALTPLISGAVLTMAAGLLAGHVEGGNRNEERLRRGQQDGAVETPSIQGGKT
jgi:hypothetical protein